jgi:hypothetical protein
LKPSTAWITGGAALLAISIVLIYVLSHRPTTSIFRCERPVANQPGECRLEESYVFGRDKVVSFQELAIRDVEPIESLPGVGRYGGDPVGVGLRLTSGQLVPVIGYDWPVVAGRYIQRINVYLADRSALSLVMKRYYLTSLYLFCDILVALLLIAVLGIHLPRKRQEKQGGVYDGLYDKRRA